MLHSSSLDITGREILLEDVRQFCLYWLSDDKRISKHYAQFMKKSPRTVYLEYMIRAHQVYGDRITEEDSHKIMKALQVNITAVDECVADTFSKDSGEVDMDKDENYVLLESLHDW